MRLKPDLKLEADPPASVNQGGNTGRLPDFADKIQVKNMGERRAGARVVRAHAINAADPGSIPAGGPLLHVTSPY